MVIYKYVIDFDGHGDAKVVLPNDAELLKIGGQDDKIVAWYKVNPDNGKSTWHFKVIMTGEEFEDEDMEYIDTVTLKGWLVCHVFEK